MSQPVSAQHPAVVLRSHYTHLRALLAVALIVIAGLTVAVVAISTNDNSTPASAQSSAPPASTSTSRYDGGPEEGTAGITQIKPGVRFDGGREEGTSGPGH